MNSQMFAMAVRHDAIATNPMREVRPVARRRRNIQVLSLEQARTLLKLTAAHRDGRARDACGSLVGGRARTPDLHDLVLLLLATGMRIGEALALQWSDLDLTTYAGLAAGGKRGRDPHLLLRYVTGEMKPRGLRLLLKIMMESCRIGSIRVSGSAVRSCRLGQIATRTPRFGMRIADMTRIE